MKRTLTALGKPFIFSKASLEKANTAVGKYPAGRQGSALKEILYIAQEQAGGWLPREALETVAEFLSLPLIQVYEIATFYTLFNLTPVGKYHVQVCTTTPCWLRGSGDVLEVCHKKAREHGAEAFTVSEVECLGACVNAPVVQINRDYYEDLTAESMEKVLENLQAGKKVKKGSQTDRQGSAPANPSDYEETYASR